MLKRSAYVLIFVSIGYLTIKLASWFTNKKSRKRSNLGY
jgi:hypothetical protein